MVDISERKRAEQALRESEERYRTLVDNFPNGAVVLFNHELRYLIAGGTGLAKVGLIGDKIEGKTVWEVFPPEICQAVEADYHAALDGKTVFNEITFMDYVFFTHTLPIRNINGEIIAGMVVVQDISEQVQAEKVIQSTERRYKALFENAPDGVVLVSADGRFSYASPSALRIFGYQHDDLLSYQPAELTHPEDLPMVEDALQRLIEDKTEDKPTIRYRFLNSAGDYRWIESTFTNLMEEESVQAIVINFRDISEQMAAEQRLKQTQKELELRVAERTADLNAQVAESEQLNSALTNLLEDLQAAHASLDSTSRKLLEANQELEAFTYSVSHDLRAPLRAINGFSRILVEGYKSELTSTAEQYLGLIQDGAQQMDQLILDLLNLSRLGRTQLKKQLVDPGQVVEQVIRDLSKEIKEHGIQVDLQDLPACCMDPVLMKQVYTNLISNAVKFSGNKADARIEIGSLIQPTGPDEASETQEETVYYVRDNGVGFDMAYVEKLFNVFQRLHLPEDYEGTGIGLAIVKRIVHRHGGRVWAEGEVGKGAAFYFTIPE